ncbi:hypothetical protein A2U01_0074417 [Trifolium medium]|uniref:Uncharacterized protein n=1 Tax=Trifolium medium TaxID=97028 RepID=A0A392SWE0_9FABA|nr:hypothetical protein [Trifolium medium]
MIVKLLAKEERRGIFGIEVLKFRLKLKKLRMGRKTDVLKPEVTAFSPKARGFVAWGDSFAGCVTFG